MGPGGGGGGGGMHTERTQENNSDTHQKDGNCESLSDTDWQHADTIKDEKLVRQQDDPTFQRDVR